MPSILSNSKKKSVFSLGVETLQRTVNWNVSTNNFPENLVCPKDNTFLSKNEFLVYCVYDRSHRVANGKYGDHLTKCRRNYVVDLEKKGCPVEIVKCAVNPEHWGYVPELSFHEYNCSDKCYLELEAIYLNGAAEWNEHYRTIRELKKELANAPMDLIDRYLKESVVVKENPYDNFSKLYDYFMELVKEHPTPFQVQSVRYKMLKIKQNLSLRGSEIAEAEPVAQPKELFDQTKDPDAIGFIRRRRRIHKRYYYHKVQFMAQIEEEPDDDEQEWEFKDNQPGFSWVEMQFNLDPTLRRCPPGLTRAERKEWEKQGTQRLMTEKGIFSQDELEAALQRHNDTETLELEWNKIEDTN